MDKLSSFEFENWSEKEFAYLRETLASLAHPENVEWENRIVNTGYPLLSVYTKPLREIAKSIAKGNARSFLAGNPCCYHEELVLQCLVIGALKDADEQMRLLPSFLAKCDSWAHTDSLKFRITKENSDVWFEYAKSLTRAHGVFERRCGLLIFFKFLQTDKLQDIFAVLASMREEKEYYVNMAISWLVCEAFVKRRDETLAFLASDSLSLWTQNKAISKCRDSFRVSPSDKELLLTLKK